MIYHLDSPFVTLRLNTMLPWPTCCVCLSWTAGNVGLPTAAAADQRILPGYSATKPFVLPSGGFNELPEELHSQMPPYRAKPPSPGCNLAWPGEGFLPWTTIRCVLTPSLPGQFDCTLQLRIRRHTTMPNASTPRLKG